MNWVRQHKFECFFLGFALIVLLLRLLNIVHRLLVYDELWTCINYASKDIYTIFTDVSTPNNHPLNSLLIGWFCGIIGLGNVAIRLPALLAFAKTFLLLLFTSKQCFRHNAPRFLVCTAFLLHGGLQYYAETARGYSLQTLGVTMVLLSFLLYDREEQIRKRVSMTIMFLIGALIASLAVSSGVIFVTALAGTWLLLSLIKEKRAFFARARIMFAGFIIYAIFVLCWYGGNYAAFAQGQSFGDTLDNAAAIWKLLSGLREHLGIAALSGFFCGIAGIVFCWKNYRKELLLTGISALLIFVSAFASKAGPPRVYLPFVIVLIFGAGFALDILMQKGKLAVLEKRNGLLIGLLLIACCLVESRYLYRKWAEPDWRICVESIMKEVPKSVAVAYPPTDVLALCSHFDKEIVQDHLHRLEAPEHLMLTASNLLGVMDQKDFHTTFFSFEGEKNIRSSTLGEIPYWVYPLRPLQATDKVAERKVFCVIKGLQLGTLPQELKEFPVVNYFLGSNETAWKYPPALLLYVQGKQTAAELLKLEQEYPVRFLTVP